MAQNEMAQKMNRYKYDKFLTAKRELACLSLGEQPLLPACQLCLVLEGPALPFWFAEFPVLKLRPSGGLYQLQTGASTTIQT